MKTEEELRKLFYNYTNGHIEISASETEPVMDVDAFIKLMTELNLCNKHIVSNNEVAVCTTEEGKCISQKRVIMCTRKEHCGFKQTDC